MTATLDGPATAVAVGELQTVALAGGAAPAELGGRCRRIVDGAIDDHGGLALSVELAGSSTAGAVIWRPSVGGAARVAARAGDPAPGGGRFRRFHELDLADGGQVLFRASLSDCATAEGLFLRGTDGAITAVALAGGPYTGFAQPTLVTARSLAFVAGLADGRTCVVQHSMISLCSGAQRTGDVVEHDLAISRLGTGGLCCIARVRGGERRFTRALVSGTAGPPAEWLRTGAELPGHGRVTRLLTPPAVCAELGFVTVGLDSGRTALCSCAPAVLASSGDPLPGLAGERIGRIGAPVASSSAAPFGVACPIRLAGGRAALWVGVFEGRLPFHGAAIVPWLDGERATDRPDLAVSRLAPVKFGNDGTLLLRAILGPPGERRTSLLTLSGLFGWNGR